MIRKTTENERSSRSSFENSLNLSTMEAIERARIIEKSQARITVQAATVRLRSPITETETVITYDVKKHGKVHCSLINILAWHFLR